MPTIESFLQQVGLDWALHSDAFGQLQRTAEKFNYNPQVELVKDAACLTEYRKLGIGKDLDLQMFKILLQRVCVFDFFIERDFVGQEGLRRFQDTLDIVRRSLEEDVLVRQALLEELRHCSLVLSSCLSFAQQAPSGEPACSDGLRHFLTELSTGKA